VLAAGCVAAITALAAGAAEKAKEPAALVMDKPAAKTPWVRYGSWPADDWAAFNTLGKLASPPAGKAIKLDRPVEGDPEQGAKLAFDRSRGGSCVACHVLGDKTPDLPGNVGPDLSQIGTHRDDTWLTNYVTEPRVYNPVTMMPPWGTHKVFTPEEIQHIVAFLKTLKTPKTFKNPLDDPAKRPVPKEERDNLDPVENPGMFGVDDGIALYSKAGPSGKSCASCHEQPEKVFKTWAATMPRYEPRMKKVLGVEEFVARHAMATAGAQYLMGSKENNALAIYLRNLANGTPIKVDVSSKGAKEAVKRAKDLMGRKVGQLNFACTDCHKLAANKWIRGQWLVELKGTYAHFPTYRTSRSEIWDIRKRFQWCNVAIRANELPPDAPEYGDLELYLASRNNGEKLDVPGIRH
jgi:sulfur-oxidizing protein SoxA